MRRRRPKEPKLSLHAPLHEFVREKLQTRCHPQQISRALRTAHPDDPLMRLSHEGIYRAIYRPGSGLLCKPASSPLLTGRDHRRAHARQIRVGRWFAQPMLSIHERQFDPSDRSVPGHWEGDLIVGPNHRSSIGTVVERQTRYGKFLHLPAQDSFALHAVLVEAMGSLPAGLRRSLTWEHGKELARHLEITRDTGFNVYFCDAASSRQRGSNENANGLLRQYLLKSTALSRHSPHDLACAEDELNQRPRATLDDKTPAELFERFLA